MNRDHNTNRILRQLNGEASPEEVDSFSNWLLENPENFDLFIEIKKIWEADMRKEIKFDSQNARNRINKTVKIQKKKEFVLNNLQRIAAAVVIIASLAGLTFYYTLDDINVRIAEATIVNQITKSSNAGEQLRLTLPDGSIVLLNAQSSIQFPERFDKNSRQVVLEGEAFFDVTKDPNRPFIVKTRNLNTTVLGTSFNIRAFKGKESFVTVSTGKVKVENLDSKEHLQVQLLPNEQVVVNPNADEFNVNEVNAKNYITWTFGCLKFNNEDLEDVASELERWFDVKITLENINSSNLKVNGSFKEKKLYNILDGLCYMYDLEYKFNSETEILIYQKQLPMKNP